MKGSLAAGILVAAFLVASAAAQEFVPFTVDKADADAFTTWLDEQPIPRKYTNQIVAWLAQMEQRAVTAKAAAARAKAPQEPPAPK